MLDCRSLCEDSSTLPESSEAVVQAFRNQVIYPFVFRQPVTFLLLCIVLCCLSYIHRSHMLYSLARGLKTTTFLGNSHWLVELIDGAGIFLALLMDMSSYTIK